MKNTECTKKNSEIHTERWGGGGGSDIVGRKGYYISSESEKSNMGQESK